MYHLFRLRVDPSSPHPPPHHNRPACERTLAPTHAHHRLLLSSVSFKCGRGLALIVDDVFGSNEGLRAGMSRRAGSPVILPKRPRLEKSAPSGAQSVEVLERDVSCPVCYDVIISPILQCGEGHLICMDCLGHITQPLKCPTCREPYPSDAPARNRALEQLVAQMTVSCAYCRGKYKACDRDAHNAICSGRPIDCPYTGCHATVPVSYTHLRAHET